MKKVGIALGGGGARGVAHIAYLKAIDELGIKPSVISGTSSGSLVGALYAGGIKPDDIYALIKNLFRMKRKSASTLKNLENIPSGIVSSYAVKLLHRALPKHQFEDLDVPLKVVATNFNTLEEQVFTSGDIVSALMGSIALPGVFAPYNIDGEYYMDGGATNIVPFDIIRDECDILIAIDVSKVRTNTLSPNMKNSLHATWAATHKALISYKLNASPVEIFERPNFDKVATMEFHKYKYVYKRAEEYLPDFIQKLKTII